MFCLCGKKLCFWDTTAQAAHIQLTRGYYHVNEANRFHWWSVQINHCVCGYVWLAWVLRSMQVWISTFLYKKQQNVTEDLHTKTYKHAWHMECLLRPQTSSVCSYNQGSASNSPPLSQWERTTHPQHTDVTLDLTDSPSPMFLFLSGCPSLCFTAYISVSESLLSMLTFQWVLNICTLSVTLIRNCTHSMFTNGAYAHRKSPFKASAFNTLIFSLFV